VTFEHRDARRNFTERLGGLFLGGPGVVDPGRTIRCISFTAQLELT
jgi:hypothetical protein